MSKNWVPGARRDEDSLRRLSREVTGKWVLVGPAPALLSRQRDRNRKILMNLGVNRLDGA